MLQKLSSTCTLIIRFLYGVSEYLPKNAITALLKKRLTESLLHLPPLVFVTEVQHGHFFLQLDNYKFQLAFVSGALDWVLSHVEITRAVSQFPERPTLHQSFFFFNL